MASEYYFNHLSSWEIESCNQINPLLLSTVYAEHLKECDLCSKQLLEISLKAQFNEFMSLNLHKKYTYKF